MTRLSHSLQYSVVLFCLALLSCVEPRIEKQGLEEKTSFNGENEESWDLALGRPIVASSFLEGFPPEAMVDDLSEPFCWRVDEGENIAWFDSFWMALG